MGTKRPKKPALVRVQLPSRARRALRVAQAVHDWTYRKVRKYIVPAILHSIEEREPGTFQFRFEVFAQNGEGQPLAYTAEEVMIVRMERNERGASLVTEVVHVPATPLTEDDVMAPTSWSGRALTTIIRRAKLFRRDFVNLPHYGDDWRVVEKADDRKLAAEVPHLWGATFDAGSFQLRVRENPFMSAPDDIPVTDDED